MKTIILQENLHKAISVVGKFISVRTQLPILSHLLFETEEGRLKISSTNLETSASYWVGADNKKAGKICVPARLIADLVSSLPQEKVELEAEQGQLHLLCANSEATLAGADPSDFPPLPEIKDKTTLQFKKEDINEVLPFVLVAASQDEARPLLTGVKFLKKEKELYLVATDGYRLSLKKNSQVKGLNQDFVISGKALGEVYRLFNEEKNEEMGASISNNNQVVFVFPQAQIATRLIEGEYPDFEKIIPTGFTTRTIFAKEPLQKAVRLASVYAREAANIVRFDIKNNQATISANSPQIGQNQTQIEVKTEGEGGEIAFNARFLLDLLGVFPAEEIAFEMSGPLAPGVFKHPTDDSYLHIIMPVRVQG